MKKVIKWIAIVVLILGTIAGAIYFIYLRPFMEKMQAMSTVQYDKNLTLVLGGGGNSGILSSDSLVLVIDTKMDDGARKLYEQVKQIAGNKPIIVVNTHVHPDHTKGNKYYKGQTIIGGGNYTRESWIKEGSEESLPTKWLKDKMDIRVGDDTVSIINLESNIHTSSDMVVYLHKQKMLFTGDIVLNKQVPFILGKADPDNYLTAMDWFQHHFDIQKVVPGHGAVGGPEVIDQFRTYLQDMKLAASDDSKRDALEAKYKDWNQLPLVMSPSATIKAFKKKMGK